MLSGLARALLIISARIMSVQHDYTLQCSGWTAGQTQCRHGATLLNNILSNSAMPVTVSSCTFGYLQTTMPPTRALRPARVLLGSCIATVLLIEFHLCAAGSQNGSISSATIHIGVTVQPIYHKKTVQPIHAEAGRFFIFIFLQRKSQRVSESDQHLLRSQIRNWP